MLLNLLALKFERNLKGLHLEAKTQELQNKWHKVHKGFKKMYKEENQFKSKRLDDNRCIILQDEDEDEDAESCAAKNS